MATTETASLHLAYGDDERINRNWDILDGFLRRLDRGTVIPDDAFIQGSLEVQGDGIIHGNLQVDGTMTVEELNVSRLGAVDALINNLVVDGTAEFPFESIGSAALRRGASVYDFGTGAVGAVMPIVDFEDRELCNVQLSQENLSFPTLVIGSVTLQFQIGNIAGPRTVSARLSLCREDVALAVRSLNYTYTSANNLSIDYPITLVRYGLPLNPGKWKIKGTITAGIPGGGGIAVIATFAQVMAIHFR